MRSITAAGPLMLSRTQDILRECKEVWPLASRWLDSLDRFFRDPNATPLEAEDSLDDPRDLPPGVLGWVTAASSPPPAHPQDMASSFSDSAYPKAAHFPQRQGFTQHQNIHQQQQHQDGDSLAHQPDAFSFQPEPHLMLGSGHPHPPPAPPPEEAMYFPGGPIHQVDDMGDVIMGAFHHHQHDHAHYGMNPASAVNFSAPTGAAPFYSATGPRPHKDGYEIELQSYIGGFAEWLQPTD